LRHYHPISSVPLVDENEATYEDEIESWGGVIFRMSQNRAAEKDRLAALDFKVNLKSELMLEELIRKQRERDVQMEELNRALANLQKSNRTQDSERSDT
jgi:uncharacterized membrane protein